MQRGSRSAARTQARKPTHTASRAKHTRVVC